MTAFHDDFRNFLWLVWTEALGLPEPDEVQYNIAWELQHGWEPSEDGITRMQLQAFRGEGKTYALCAWACWQWLLDPDRKILFISMNTNRAKEAVRLCRQILNSLDICAHLVPREGQRDGADRFDVGAVTRPAKDPSLAAYGITSAIAGTHPDDIVADDTETKDNARTAALREYLLAAYYEFENMIKPGGRIIHMGTPQSGDSVYNHLRRDYHLKRWPCRFPDPNDSDGCAYIAPWCVQKVLDGEAKPGDPVCPERFGETVLAEKMSIMGPYHFALQYMLDTTLADSDRYPLKLSDLVVMDLHPDKAPANVVWGNTHAVEGIKSEGFGNDRLYKPNYVEEPYLDYQTGLMFVDPSGGRDKVGYAVIKGLNGLLYCLEAGGLAGGHSEGTMVKLATIAQFWGIKRVIVESNFGAGARNEPSLYEKALAHVMGRINGPTQIEGRRVRGQKEKRICDTLEPVLCSHRLVINTRVAKHAELMNQLTHITRDRGSLPRDDEIDALAGAVEEFRDMLGMDPVVQEARRKQAEIEQMAADFARSCREGPGFIGFEGKQPDMTGRDPRIPRRDPWLTKGKRWTNV